MIVGRHFRSTPTNRHPQLGKSDQTLIDQSILEARKALSIDPNSVLALRALTRAYGFSVLYQMAADREYAIREAMSAIAHFRPSTILELATEVVFASKGG
jgi:hypothetical protein